MTAVLRIAGMTRRQVLGVRRLVGLGVLAVVPAVVMYLTTARSTGSARLDTFAGITGGLFLSVVVPVIALILSTSALGDERRDQTLSFIVLRPVSRTAIAFAKILGGVGSACLVSGIGAVALGVAMGLRGGGWGYLVPTVVGTIIATAAYGGVFTPLGYLTERATLLGLAFVFIWEGAVAGTIPGLAAMSPWRIGLSALVGLGPGELLAVIPDFALGSVAPGAGGAALKAVVIVALGTWFTGWLLRTRDLA